MRLTRKRIDAVLEQAKEICSLATDFLREGIGRWEDVLIDSDSQLYYMVNTACHCHPEYEKEYVDLNDFYKWIEKRNESNQ